MKTLREYVDQLDEISRRDALKYAGATAAGAALGQPKNAKAQVGVGEEESEQAAYRAASAWQQYARDNESVTSWVYETIQRRSMQFYQLARGRDLQNGTETALRDAINSVSKEFEMINDIIEKEKGSGNLLKGMAFGAFGARDLARNELYKNQGSMRRFDLRNIAQRFVKAYTNSLNRSLQSISQTSDSQEPQQTSQSSSYNNVERDNRDSDKYAPIREPQQTSQSSSYDNVERDNRGSDKYALIRKPQQTSQKWSYADKETINDLINLVVLSKDQTIQKLAWEILREINSLQKIPELRNLIDRKKIRSQNIARSTDRDEVGEYSTEFLKSNIKSHQQSIINRGYAIIFQIDSARSQKP